ncbi:photosystem II PsbR protein, chloroplast precursor [Micromonas pusilla CCMP1545]|uniref:Photosystem II PsbR protein, chloroplast n=1 Tax=Micromonas pusilla (strain CCMP1545) TaxID=564608 RepID=C1MLX9_MICPC|nr:photosystem II PsbR protein, chloroplast precursor [Micromonas pusilla CCMP1545]EEH58943.1 photosystem II PsbR protein, chloroplast precursor [Micromonas pusilla CCMP1545]|eukprot:XP_003057298.1 photosystem II PsbR protein, chloroplast precursor [Micromonas pusilla CCMP1545]
MAAIMASSSAFAGVKVQARVAAKNTRAKTVIMANSSGPKRGTKAKGGQAGVGYKGSTEGGSAPKTRSGKAGYVYKLGLRNGKANVDEYSPIYTPEEFKTDGDKYEGDLKLAAAAVVGVVGTGALAILLTSAL